MTLGEKIQLCRKKKCMSQEDLANLLNVSRQAVQKWESNASIPELDKLVAISNMFDVSLDYLVKDLPEPEKPKEEAKPQTISEEQPEPISNHGYFKAIRILIWIGIFLTPSSLAFSFYRILGNNPLVALFFLDFLITIPLGILSLRCVNRAKRKSQFIPFGILNVIFLSQVAGILMLAAPNGMFLEKQDSEEVVAQKEETKVKEKKQKVKVVKPKVEHEKGAMAFLSRTHLVLIFNLLGLVALSVLAILSVTTYKGEINTEPYIENIAIYFPAITGISLLVLVISFFLKKNNKDNEQYNSRILLVVSFFVLALSIFMMVNYHPYTIHFNEYIIYVILGFGIFEVLFSTILFFIWKTYHKVFYLGQAIYFLFFGIFCISLFVDSSYFINFSFDSGIEYSMLVIKIIALAGLILTSAILGIKGTMEDKNKKDL